MCIIIYKPMDVPAPTEAIINTCFTNNPDGAGVAVLRRGSRFVEIDKGFMTCPDYLDHVQAVVQEDDLAVYHFRIGTSGGNIPANTHPFPVTKNIGYLKALHTNTPYAFIHNGVLGAGEKDLSDTQCFVRDYMTDIAPHLKESKKVRDKLDKLTKGSRTATVDAANAYIYLSGKWIYDTDNGLYFSNDTYKRPLYSDFLWDDNVEPETFKCIHCGGTSELISLFHDLYECSTCGEITDAYGRVVFPATF